MEHYAFIDIATGRVMQTGICQEGMIEQMIPREGWAILEHAGEIESGRDFVTAEGEVIAAPASPAPWAVFDLTTRVWVDPRDDAGRAADAIKALMEARDVSISRAQFCNAIASLGVVSDAEAVAGAKGEWPASLGDFLGYLTPAQARDVQIEWAACVTVQRMHPFVLVLGSWLGLSDADLDALFGI